MARAEQNVMTAGSGRIFWLDNLRTVMIFLVVMIHAVIVYEKNFMGAGWWIVCDPSGSDVFGIVFLILNIFVMATVFFVAGYVAPLSMKNKSAWAFIAAKFKRLMLPWLIAVLTLIPLYKIIFLYAQGLPQESWTTYFHWNTVWNQNWLWFLPVLFVFEVAYVLIAKINLKVSYKTMMMGGFVICLVYSVCMDFFNLHGWTKTLLIDFQNERVLLYLVMFVLGGFCCKNGVFEGNWYHKTLDIVLHSIGWIPVNLYIFLLIYSMVHPGEFLVSDLVDTILIRLNFVLAMGYMVYAMVTTFKRFFNRQGTIMGRLNRNSYGVYIIHVVVLGSIATMMIGSGIPALVKGLILTIGTFVLSNMIVCGFGWVWKLAINHKSAAHVEFKTVVN